MQKRRREEGNIFVKAKRIFFWLMAMAFVTFGISAAAQAANTATQTVTYTVAAIDETSLSLEPVVLVIDSATAGAQPNPATDSSTTYSITTNANNRKIIAAIDTAMPDGLTLKVRLTAPTGGNSLGDVVLTTTAADVVTDISHAKGQNLTITYTLEATVAAGVVSGMKTVTFTLTHSGH